MSKPLIVIKLGGSALTDKTRIYTPKIHTIYAAAKQITKIRKSYSLMIVHGAGSFGHIPARKYGLQNGLKDSKQLKGLTETKLKLLEWERMLDEILRAHGIPVIPFLASDFILLRNGRIATAELGPMAHWLRLGCVPTTGGDIVPDTRKGFRILSGDQIAAYLAIRLKAVKLIYGVDVDGLFDANPSLNAKAHLLESLTIRSARDLISKGTWNTTPDVTGGMAGKVTEAIAAAQRGIPVYFVNLSKDERLLKSALGRKTVGSRILPARLRVMEALRLSYR
jgi:isopentenyl phosphate kinase